MPRDVSEHPKAVSDDAADDDEQEVVEVTKERPDLRGQVRADGGFDAGGHQSEYPIRAT